MSYPQGAPGGPGYPPAQYTNAQFSAPTQQFARLPDADAAGKLPAYLSSAIAALGVLVYLASFGPPVQVPLWSWCTAYIDVANSVLMSTDFTDALGRSATPFVVPNLATLIGFDFTVQGAFLFTPDPIGIRATDGLYMVLGN